MRNLIITILAISFLHSADEAQPVEVLNALAGFEKVVVEQHKKIDPVIQKAKDEAMYKLESAKIAYTKKGDLKGALLVDESIKKLNEGDTLAAIEQNIKNNSNIFSGMTNIVGKWLDANNNNVIFTVDVSMKAIHANGSVGTVTKNNNGFTVTWATGWKDENIAWNAKKKIYTGNSIQPNGTVYGTVNLIKAK